MITCSCYGENRRAIEPVNKADLSFKDTFIKKGSKVSLDLRWAICEIIKSVEICLICGQYKTV